MTGFTFRRKQKTVVAVQVGSATTMTNANGMPLSVTAGQYLVWDQPAPNALMARVVSAHEFEADYDRVSGEPVEVPKGGHV